MLNDKVVVITGAGKGLGRFLCRKFSENGATLVMLYNNSENGVKAICEHLKTHEVYSTYKKCDITSFEETKSVISEVYNEFGKIDVLINCANIFYDKNILEFDDEILNMIINVNFKGKINMINSILPILKKQNSGKIINFSYINDFDICNSNVKQLTKDIYKDLSKYNIECNMVESAPIDKVNEVISKNSWGFEPKPNKADLNDVANAFLMLINPKYNKVTGQIIHIF